MTLSTRTSTMRVARASLLAVAMLFLAGAVPLGAASTAADSHQRAPQPPRAPTDLTVGDRVRPLEVDGPPLFGWLVRHPGGNEIQTAYEIRVTRGTSAAPVWSSGKVESSQQSYVAYGGPALQPGTAYRWTVRTWNRRGIASPWARTASFETGLGDGDWDGARWIRRATTEPDDYTMVRKEVTIGRSPIVRARAYTSAYHQYRLYLNGVEVDDGPAFSYPGEGYYQATDVTSRITAGRPLAIGAIYHWYGGGQGRPAAPNERGFLLKLVVEHADGSREVIVTDESWRVRRASQFLTAPRRNGDAGDYVERVDARLEPAGWNTAGHDARGAEWAAATVVGAHPTGAITRLTGQEPRLVGTMMRPRSVKTLADGTIVADFGVVIPARPVIRFRRGVSGRVIEMRTSYALAPDGHVSTGATDTQGSDLSMRYIQKGGQERATAFLHWSWRYLQLSAPGEPLTAADIGAIVEHTDAPVARRATFTSSDSTLNAVWDLMLRSALYSIQHQFVDTPTREKGQFLGDAADISYATMAAWGERDATQKAIREFMHSQTRYWPDGRLNAVYPNVDGKRDIPDYTEMFVDWVWRYYEETGDRTLLTDAYPVLRNVAQYVLRYVPDTGATAGLVTNLEGGSGPYRYGIIDWPSPMRYGYDMRTAVRTTINAQAVDVLRTTALAARALGRPASEADTLERRATQLASAMNAKLRRADGIYVDGLMADGSPSAHASQHANSYAVAYGVAPRESYPQLATYIAGLGMKQGPMTAHWLLQALADADRPDAVLARLTDRTTDGWANILARGGTFTWEQWNPEASESYSHGWGAQAAVDVIGTLLGLRLSSPGAATVDVVPPRVGLQYARGTVHTQRGPVTVDWRRQGAGLVLRVDVPANVRARVLLPNAEGVRYLAAGEGAPVRRGTENGREVYEVGSGRSSFTPAGRGSAPR